MQMTLVPLTTLYQHLGLIDIHCRACFSFISALDCRWEFSILRGYFRINPR